MTKPSTRRTFFDRIDEVVLDLFLILVGDIALETDHTRGQHLAALALSEQLHALLGGVAALVVLSGKILHRKHAPAVLNGQGLFINHIRIRLGKDNALCLVIFCLCQTLNIVAHDIAQVGDGHHAQIVANIPQGLLGYDVEAVAFFHKNSDYI